MRFSEIENERAAAGIDQKVLCQRADVHEQTYSRLKNRAGPRGASESTVARLKTALDQLKHEKEPTHG